MLYNDYYLNEELEKSFSCNEKPQIVDKIKEENEDGVFYNYVYSCSYCYDKECPHWKKYNQD